MARADKIELCKNESGDQHWWRLKGPNGKVLATSEMYTGKEGARSAKRSATGFGDRHSITVEAAS